MPELISIYNSMTKTQKGKFKKSYMLAFESSDQTFKRRKKNDFKDFIPAEKLWSAAYLKMKPGELFPELEELFPAKVSE